MPALTTKAAGFRYGKGYVMTLDPAQPLTLALAREMMQRDPMSAWINFRLDELGKERVLASMTVEEKHLSPLGLLYGPVVIAFADIACGLGTSLFLSDANHTFATLELKTNFMGTVGHGELLCEAVPRHTGSSTHIWDATVSSKETGRTTVLFRCTQIILGKR